MQGQQYWAKKQQSFAKVAVTVHINKLSQKVYTSAQVVDITSLIFIKCRVLFLSRLVKNETKSVRYTRFIISSATNTTPHTKYNKIKYPNGEKEIVNWV